VVSYSFLARAMVAQRNIGRSSNRIVGGLDTGYLAGKTIQRTENPGRSKENSLKVGYSQFLAHLGLVVLGSRETNFQRNSCHSNRVEEECPCAKLRLSTIPLGH